MTVRRVLTLCGIFIAASIAAWGATITITPLTLPNGAVSGAYNQTLTGTGGTGAITWTVSSGSLPTGLSLDPAAGTISGTLTQAGSFPFTISATTATPDSGSQQYTVNVIGITTATPMPGGTVGFNYSQTLTAAGGVGTLTWTLASGSLPPGLTLNSNGTISGVPNSGDTGAYPFSVTVTDSSSPTNSATGSLSISIGHLTITPTSLPSATVGNVWTTQGQLSTAPAVSGLTWSVSGGSLPTGLSLNTSTGLISGQFTAAGSPFSFTITATAAAAAASQAYSVTVAAGGASPTLDFTNFNSKAAAGVPFSSTLGGGGGVPPYTFSLQSSTASANGLSVSSGGVVSGTPIVAGATNLVVNIRDSLGNQGGGTVTVNVIGITTTSLPNGAIGATYPTQQLAAGGVVGGATWSLSGTGALPPGLALNPTLGTITGTPTTNGQYSFGVTITDGTGNSATATLTIVIGTAGALTVTTTSPITTGAINAAYSYTLQAAGGAPLYTWAVTTGSLPAGLTLASSTGIISGTPTAAGTTTFGVTVTDSNRSTATASLSILIVPALTITTTSPITPGVINTAYTNTLTAVGGTAPYTWTVTTGSLPTGLTLASSTGVLSGTPTANGTTTFGVTVTDSSSPVHTATASLTIVIGTSSLHITTTSPLPGGTISTSYTPVTLAAAGGTAPYTWSASGLPAGLTLAASTGILSGTPTATGTTTFSITVTDSSSPVASATTSFSITINAAALSITTTSPIPPGPVNVPYSKLLQAVGGTAPYTWSATGLPAGLTIAASTGVISGTPTGAGTTTFIVTVTDSSSPSLTASTSLSVVMTTPTLTVSGVTSTCFVAYVRRPFPDPEITPPGSCPTNNTYQFTATGSAAPSPSYTFGPAVAGALPPGLTLSGNGILTGTPTAAGTYTFWAVATDSLQAQGAVSATLVVRTVAQVSSPSITLGGSTGPTIGANLQPSVVLSIANTFPFPVNGTVAVSFASSVGGINSLVTFSNGLTSTFRIPAGGQATSVGAIATGTQAGTITLTATQFTDDFGNIMTPSTPATVAYTVAAGVPVITNVAVSNSTTSGFTLAVTGYSTTRDMTSAQFNFTAATGDTLTAASVTVPLTTPFTTWYSDPRSNPFGSAFVLTIPFTFSSTTSTTKPVTGVTLTMTNSKGTSAASASVTP